MLMNICNYQNQRVENVIQLVLVPVPETERIDFHNFVPFKGSHIIILWTWDWTESGEITTFSASFIQERMAKLRFAS